MKITPDIGREIWDRLIEHCGVRKTDHYEDDVLGFTLHLSEFFDKGEPFPFEWRFQGALGFGGKFRYQRSTGFYVDYYREDKTTERDVMVEAMNVWLRERFDQGVRE
jgi:hypothetical protein